MADRPRFAVIPTNGRACLKDCLMAIQPQVDLVILVYTVDEIDGELQPRPGYVLRNTTDGVNISRWWNRGLNTAEADAAASGCEQWDVAILNDDCIVPPGWMDAMCAKLRPCVAASGGAARLEGFAFVLAGESGLRADEQFRWYCGDDDLSRQAENGGGRATVYGWPVQHLYPNGQVTPEMQVLMAEDMQRYVDKHGVRPW